jgi:hypothetical protein
MMRVAVADRRLFTAARGFFAGRVPGYMKVK